MAAEMRLYRVTVIGSNAERRRGKVVDEVTVKVGTKWLTDDNGRRYYKVPSEDANRSPYFQQNTMYCKDYRLYQTEQAAKDYLRQAELCVALCRAVSNFGFNAPPACAGEGHGYAEIHPVRTAPYKRLQYADGHGCGWRVDGRRKEQEQWLLR